MTVSIDKTRRKYRGRKAETYDAVREKQQRWALENEAVEQMMIGMSLRCTVLDCPVGTGRFISMFTSMGYSVRGIDASEEMLAQARRRSKHGKRVLLEVGDAEHLPMKDRSVVAAVCVRFLDLIEEEAMQRVVTELCRVAHERVILTIRLGRNYVPKVNTATHGEAAFHRLIKRLGWRVAEQVPIFDAGWTVMRLERR